MYNQLQQNEINCLTNGAFAAKGNSVFFCNFEQDFKMNRTSISYNVSMVLQGTWMIILSKYRIPSKIDILNAVTCLKKSLRNIPKVV